MHVGLPMPSTNWLQTTESEGADMQGVNMFKIWGQTTQTDIYTFFGYLILSGSMLHFLQLWKFIHKSKPSSKYAKKSTKSYPCTL